MIYTTIIKPDQLLKILDSPELVLVDCRYDLEDPELGHQLYLTEHIPGAIYLHLDRDLSGEIIPGKTGRHPLPDPDEFTSRLASWGISNSSQVVVYDDNSGALAGRLWWMLRWLGHSQAAVLDGGFTAWISREYPLETGEIKLRKGEFTGNNLPELAVDLEFVDQIRQDQDYLLLDARSPERFWGIQEDIDSHAGHIPGAVSAPYAANLDQEGNFLPLEDLKSRFESLLEDLPSDQVVFYCGSGVSAVHNIIAMVAAGFDMPRLYPGSWSEWSLDPERPKGP